MKTQIPVAVAVVLGGCGDPDPAAELAAQMRDGPRFEYTLKGRILDPEGQPLAKTKLRYEGRFQQEGSSQHGTSGNVQAGDSP